MQKRITIGEVFLGFLQASLTSVGGAAAPLRHMAVRRRKWMTDLEFTQLFGICQILPGAVGANFAVMVGNRSGGWRGGILALLAFGLPAMILAVFLAMLAINVAKINPHIANAEFAISSAAAGLFMCNGFRVVREIVRQDPLFLRTLRLGIVALGVVLIAMLHLSLPVVVVLLLAIGMLLEWRSAKAQT